MRQVRSRKSVVGVELLTRHGEGCDSKQEAIDAIADYWEDCWQIVENEGPSIQEIIEHMLQDAPLGARRRWRPPTAEKLHRIAVAMRGSAGGDSWSGDELSCLPADIWTLYAELCRRWLDSGRLPTPLLHARTVNLVKEHKVENNKLRADHARPITVLSGFWRCFASAWLKSAQMEEWIRSFLHPSVV